MYIIYTWKPHSGISGNFRNLSGNLRIFCWTLTSITDTYLTQMHCFLAETTIILHTFGFPGTSVKRQHSAVHPFVVRFWKQDGTLNNHRLESRHICLHQKICVGHTLEALHYCLQLWAIPSNLVITLGLMLSSLQLSLAHKGRFKFSFQQVCCKWVWGPSATLQLGHNPSISAARSPTQVFCRSPCVHMIKNHGGRGGLRRVRGTAPRGYESLNIQWTVMYVYIYIFIYSIIQYIANMGEVPLQK